MREFRQFFLALTSLLLFSILTVKNTHAQNETNSPEELLAPLPKILLAEDGTSLVDASLWEQYRREEILELFRKHVYGKNPESEASIEQRVTFLDRNALEGKAIMKEVELIVSKDSDSLIITLLIFLPKQVDGPAPLFLGLNFCGNQSIHPDPGINLPQTWVMNNTALGISDNRATQSSRGGRHSRWPVEVILSRGYGLATISYGDIDPDFDDGFKNGIHGILDSPDKARDESSWGSIGAWAWGLSRAMDYLEGDEDIDRNRVAVIGHSRLGKTSLWAGAQDERFALVISNNSGCGGAALSLRGLGETVGRINSSFPHWFCDRFKTYSNNEAALPVDQHMLLSLIAPRPLYVASATEDQWADPYGEYLSLYHGSKVYELYGYKALKSNVLPPPDQPIRGGNTGYHLRSGKHDLTVYDWEQYMDFADEHMPPAKDVAEGHSLTREWIELHQKKEAILRQDGKELHLERSAFEGDEGEIVVELSGIPKG